MRLYDLHTEYGDYRVCVKLARYGYDGSLCVELITDKGEPYCRLTACLGDKSLGHDESYVDTNSCPFAESFIVSNGLGEFIGEHGRSGFCEYPVCRFDIAALTA